MESALSVSSAEGTEVQTLKVRRSALHVGELRGAFPVVYGKNIDAAQVPWLPVAHLGEKSYFPYC